MGKRYLTCIALYILSYGHCMIHLADFTWSLFGQTSLEALLEEKKYEGKIIFHKLKLDKA